MTPKGTFAALPVRAQALIIQLYEDTCKGYCDKPRYWHVANMLNYHHGLRTVSNLSAESYWFSLKRRNPTIDELLEKVFSDGEPLTILQVRYRNDGVNVEVFSETIKYFLAGQHPLSMRIFTVACFCHLLEWPEALSGLVRPCPKCSDYRLTKDSGQEKHFDSRPTAYEAFHFHNKVTGQWLSVGAHMAIPTNDGGGKPPPRESIRRMRFWIEPSLPCAFDGIPLLIRRPMLTAIVLDAFGFLTRSDLETGMLVCRRWQTVVDGHVKSLPLRHIVKAVYSDYCADAPILEIRSKSSVINGMDPVICATISDDDGISADASSLLRNAYVERLQIPSEAPEAQSKISEVLRKSVDSGDLAIGEFFSYNGHIRGHAVDTIAWLVATARLQKVTLNITLASFAQNYSRIFDAATRTTVKYLYMDIYREFDEKKLEEAQLQPATFLVIREHLMGFVFNSMCDYAIMLVRHSLPRELPCPFSPNDIVRRFLDMDSVDHFTTCVLDGLKGGPPEACTTPVAKRQSFANNDFMKRLNRSVGAELYDVYYVRNERAGATLSVLVGNKSWCRRVILMMGVVECGDEVSYPARQYGEDYDGYEEDDGDGDEEEDKEDEEVDAEVEEEQDEGAGEEDEEDDKENETE